MIKSIKILFRILTSCFRINPDFIIIGAARSGTTSLYRYLHEHPQILLSQKKEPNYFSFNFGKLNYLKYKLFPKYF